VSSASVGFCDWAAAALLARLRDGEPPEELTPGELNWTPMRERFRAALRPSDAALVERFLGDDRTVMWGAVMSRAVEGEGITQALLEAFRRETDFERRLGLFHHITVRPLGTAEREELASWCERWDDAVIEEQVGLFSGPAGEQWLRDRLSDPAYELKRWFYMYTAHALAPASARRLLHEHLDDVDPLVARSAARSLAKLAPRVLLSYRRLDGVHAVARLHDALVSRLGTPAVMRDVTMLNHGERFLQRLAEAIQGCSAILVVIGPHWDVARLWDEGDVVRYELMMAHEHRVPMIPVLLDGGQLPLRKQLPPELGELLDRQAAVIRADPDFHADVDQLVRALDRLRSTGIPLR
jgi:hypothetical protein